MPRSAIRPTPGRERGAAPRIAGAIAGTLAAVTLACAADDDDGSAGADASSSAAIDTGCAHAPDDVVHQSACPLSQVCPATFRYGGVLGCQGPLALGKPYSSDERCVLTALAAGQPARLVLEEACGDAREEITLDLLGGREVVLGRRRVDPCDACGCAAGDITWGSVDRCTLAPLGQFSACLDPAVAVDPAARIACMTLEGWLVGCDDVGPRCSLEP